MLLLRELLMMRRLSSGGTSWLNGGVTLLCLPILYPYSMAL